MQHKTVSGAIRLRLSSPYINHFLSADTIVPDMSNPQSTSQHERKHGSITHFINRCKVCAQVLFIDGPRQSLWLTQIMPLRDHGACQRRAFGNQEAVE
ncbi:MAG TPA: hypothetical protein VJ785_04385 [Anaerolineales bacterium]|nr:hypothetical protein [Anaerolineales bacterium]